MTQPAAMVRHPIRSMPDPSEPPQYTKYRAAPRLLRRGPRPGEPRVDELRDIDPAGAAEVDGGDRGHGSVRTYRRRGLPHPRLPRGPVNGWRVLRWVVGAAVAWIVLSILVFLVSAQIHQENVNVTLGGAGYPLTSANTILVLGSDARPKGSKEPGAATSGSRSDSIMLMRVGGGANARLSIPRDTVVDIPSHGRDKINAAYAYGGPELAVRTIEQYLGVKINHVIEVNFVNFPELIDAMGGITYQGGCVVSKINGGFKNGGYTLRLKKGKTHIDGRQALALARTRHNLCNPRESDLTRARRQQKILSSMKRRLFTPAAFIRLPWIAWEVPKALRSDMSGPTLAGLFGALATSGSPPTRILKPSGTAITPGGGAGLTVSDAEKQHEVRRFLHG